MNRRLLGKIIMIAGLALAFESVMDTSMSHTQWIVISKSMPEGDFVSRDVAHNALRDLQLAVSKNKRIVIFPIILIFVGGLLNGAKRKS